MTLAIVGGGAFGTALATTYAQTHDVNLWSRNASTLLQSRISHRLPDVQIPQAVTITDDLAALHQATVLLALPMQQLGAFLDTLPAETQPLALIACCKGIDLNTGLGPVDLIDRARPTRDAAILSGPSFAADIARGLPTALVIAARKDATAKKLQGDLTCETLRLYRSIDVPGVQFGGALKNVMAIACGATYGSGLGVSARAALMTRGLSEMTRFASYFGGQAQTLAGLSGFGDLVLTATSEQSRNYRYGLALGQGKAFDDTITVEGIATAKAVVALADQHALDMPIAATVAKLVDQTISVEEAMSLLLARPLTSE